MSNTEAQTKTRRIAHPMNTPYVQPMTVLLGRCNAALERVEETGHAGRIDAVGSTVREIEKTIKLLQKKNNKPVQHMPRRMEWLTNLVDNFDRNY